MKKPIIFLLLLCSGLVTFGQKSDSTVKRKPVNLDSIHVVRLVIDTTTNDTFFVYEFEELALMDFATKEQRDEYFRLVHNVKKVLPYAKLAAFRIQMMEDNLHLLTDEKAKAKYIKETEKAIKDEFMETMKNFSRSQGLLMIKLIHRECGKTTYEILKGYRGSVETFYWSAFAAMYNASLKSEFDPIIDYQIEMIIKKYNLE
ncbi:MAG: DUF4294 domain-containing protein [Flavobacteriales bacterium]|nr:DUF4294 domain-containing protein [Bacteroidota bacterium]MCB9240545.1 DUF4294 domain-containing protein [Flavobacteriales bacterium]